MFEHVPRFHARDAERMARDLFALDAHATPLTSERDQNFLLGTHDGARIVLKIANATEDRAMLEAQQRAITHLARTLDIVPKVITTRGGAQIASVTATDGQTHFAWAVSYLGGVPLATMHRRTTGLLEDFGRRVGELNRGLADFDHAAIHREFHWDLARGLDVIGEHRALVDDLALGATIDTLVARFETRVSPLLASLPRSAIHNDLNDHNVLAGGGTDLYSRNQRVSGIVDFGDMVHSYTIGDLAIAAAYLALGTNDPLPSIAALVRGRHAVLPLAENEISALFGLTCLRLCTSACLAAYQRVQNPGNDYLDVSQQAVGVTLPALEQIPFGVAEAVFREACGLEPVAASSSVRVWLSANSTTFAPVIDCDLRFEPCTVLDLSIGGWLSSGNPEENTEPPLTRRVNELLRIGGTRVGIGRYDEARLLYMAPAFANGASPDEERRMVHIGLDLFADAGTPVFAPMAGVVHAFAYNPDPQDYGHVIVLRHTTRDGIAFHTLYGHLSQASLEGHFVGRKIARGEQIATLGAPRENGGWTPHLHLQVMTDLLGLDTDFPGVARASQRAVWRSLSPDPNLIVGIPVSRFPMVLPTKARTLARRQHVIGANVSVAYRDPIRATRGWKQFLFDDEGRRYLDAYNNVPHVGHSHPRVVQAAQQQMAVLNTNTRYLNDHLAEYADRLVATLPSPLRVCVLVNSASEANELALRMARAYTKQRDMIVLDAAYHGNTTSLIDLSPYKHAGPGGAGAPDWVHVAPLPDDYRGRFKRDDPNAGAKYAAQVAEIIGDMTRRERGLAGFIAETCPSVGGQIMLPFGYLAEVYRLVRAAGGVCIADEVQTGLGRIGTHFWAFEAHDVVPDIVVMGKPLGNGHPMAAVVTTYAIADAFNNGMEFFSTFGGNNVSCAAGLAVLDVLRDEQLQSHALRVGERMLAGLRPMVERYPMVGDVRGSGLFLGVELVCDRSTLEPAAAEASFVVNRMREMGILLGTDGPHHNVVKIRPPMPFDLSDADRLVASLDRILADEL